MKKILNLVIQYYILHKIIVPAGCKITYFVCNEITIISVHENLQRLRNKVAN